MFVFRPFCTTTNFGINSCFFWIYIKSSWNHNGIYRMGKQQANSKQIQSNSLLSKIVVSPCYYFIVYITNLGLFNCFINSILHSISMTMQTRRKQNNNYHVEGGFNETTHQHTPKLSSIRCQKQPLSINFQLGRACTQTPPRS